MALHVGREKQSVKTAGWGSLFAASLKFLKNQTILRAQLRGWGKTSGVTEFWALSPAQNDASSVPPEGSVKMVAEAGLLSVADSSPGFSFAESSESSVPSESSEGSEPSGNLQGIFRESESSEFTGGSAFSEQVASQLLVLLSFFISQLIQSSHIEICEQRLQRLGSVETEGQQEGNASTSTTSPARGTSGFSSSSTSSYHFSPSTSSSRPGLVRNERICGNESDLAESAETASSDSERVFAIFGISQKGDSSASEGEEDSPAENQTGVLQPYGNQFCPESDEFSEEDEAERFLRIANPTNPRFQAAQDILQMGQIPVGGEFRVPPFLMEDIGREPAASSGFFTWPARRIIGPMVDPQSVFRFAELQPVQQIAAPQPGFQLSGEQPKLQGAAAQPNLLTAAQQPNLQIPGSQPTQQMQNLQNLQGFLPLAADFPVPAQNVFYSQSGSAPNSSVFVPPPPYEEGTVCPGLDRVGQSWYQEHRPPPVSVELDSQSGVPQGESEMGCDFASRQSSVTMCSGENDFVENDFWTIWPPNVDWKLKLRGDSNAGQIGIVLQPQKIPRAKHFSLRMTTLFSKNGKKGKLFG